MFVNRLGAVILAAVAALAATVPAHAAGPIAGTPAVPIPSDPRGATVQPFVGHAATARPMRDVRIPRHPFMAPNQDSNLHDDAYQTDAYARSGPLGRDLQVSSTAYGVGDCASVTFDSHGRIVTVCVGLDHPTLSLLDPTTLATLGSYDLPSRPSGSGFSATNFAGGGYFYLDQHDRAVVTTYTDHLLVLEEDGTTFTPVRDVDLSKAAGGSPIQSALPDWAGRIWWVTQSGVVGFVTRSGAVVHHRLGHGETIANSFAIDESGGVFVVSTKALYRFDVVAGRVHTTWRQAYDRGHEQKPGQVSQGSGTTPTLIGSASSRGGGSVAILDNADPRMHVLVFRRGKAGPGPALCDQPIFPAGHSADENSLISVPGGLIAENNDGYVLDATAARQPDTTPGLVRVDVDYRRGGCHIAWDDTTARVPSSVSKVSLGNGLLYAYTHPAASEIPYQGPTPPDALAPDAWFLTAYSARTGAQVWSRYVGSGLSYDNHYAAIALGPDGAAYVGAIGGLIRVADGS